MPSSIVISSTMPLTPTGSPLLSALAQPLNAPPCSSRQIDEAGKLVLEYVGQRDDSGHERRCAAILAALAWIHRRFNQRGGADMEPLRRDLTQHLERSCSEGADAEALADALASLCSKNATDGQSPGPSPVHVQLAHDVLATLDRGVDARQLLSELIGGLPEQHGGDDNGVDELYRSALCAWVAIAPPGNEGRAIARDRILNMTNGKLNLQRLGLRSLPDLPRGLMTLDARFNLLSHLPTLPASLEKLYAGSNQLTHLPTLPANLTMLAVHGNRLPRLPALPPGLTMLNVTANQLTRLPDLPVSLTSLWAANNQLTHLPSSVLSMPRDGEAIIDGNPISAAALRRLHEITSAPGYNGPQIYFSMAALGANNAATRPLHEAVRDWFSNNEEAQVGQWQAHSEEAHAAEFSRFLDRLKENPVNDNVEFKTAVAKWLSKVVQDKELRRLVLQIVQEATTSCEDRIALTYNNLTKLGEAHAVSRGDYDNRLDEVIERGRGAFRLDALESIARKKAQTLRLVDEIEVYLAYQVHLREPLKLPTDIASMRYFKLSGVTPQDLKDAEQEVLARERAEFPRYFLVEWEPWQQVLGRLAPEGTERARQKLQDMLPEYEQEMVARLASLGLPEDHETQAQVGVDLMKRQQLAVYEELTREFLRQRGKDVLMDRILGAANR
jgi:E3 ubiquitin-protein ligase SspH2